MPCVELDFDAWRWEKPQLRFLELIRDRGAASCNGRYRSYCRADIDFTYADTVSQLLRRYSAEVHRRQWNIAIPAADKDFSPHLQFSRPSAIVSSMYLANAAVLCQISHESLTAECIPGSRRWSDRDFSLADPDFDYWATTYLGCLFDAQSEARSDRVDARAQSITSVILCVRYRQRVWCPVSTNHNEDHHGAMPRMIHWMIKDD